MKTNKIEEIRTDIYPCMSKVYAYQLRILDEWQGSSKNRKLLEGYVQRRFAKGNAEQTVAKRMTMLRGICDIAGKDLDTLTKDDAERIVTTLNRDKTRADPTKGDYRKEFKRIMMWISETDPRLNTDSAIIRLEANQLYKYIEKEVSGKYKQKALDYSETINDADFAKLINACISPMERAMVATLFYTGIRLGELLGIRRRDIELKENYAMIRVNGKTGERRVPILEAIPYLMDWMKYHPYQDNENALMWLSSNHKYYHQPLRSIGVQKTLVRVFERANVVKKRNPHWFRHSRATIWAQSYSESVLCKLMGWTEGSKQVKTYVHLGGTQVQEAFMIQNNIKQETPKETSVIKCTCGTLNHKLQRYCQTCFKPLTLDIALNDEEKKNTAINEAMTIMSEVMKDPELRARFDLMRGA
jgi:integrase